METQKQTAPGNFGGKAAYNDNLVSTPTDDTAVLWPATLNVLFKAGWFLIGCQCLIVVVCIFYSVECLNKFLNSIFIVLFIILGDNILFIISMQN